MPILALCSGAAPMPGGAVEQMRLGFRLAAWARASGDADAMLAAARIVAASGARPATMAGGAIRPLPGDAPTPAAKLADEAQQMANGDARIAAGADAVRSAVARGFMGGPSGAGPLAVERRLAPRAGLAWSARARGGEMAIISAVGDGDSNIDLRVTDGAGRAICADRGRDYYPMCRWSVSRAGTYRITVMNSGAVTSNVMVLSN